MITWNADDNTSALVDDEIEIFAQRYLGPATIRLSQSEYTVSELDLFATITVERTGDLSNSVSIDYATSDGTAIDPIDYVGVSGTLFFGPDQTQASFTVGGLLDAPFPENIETVNITLSNPIALSGEEAVLELRRAASILNILPEPVDLLPDTGRRVFYDPTVGPNCFIATAAYGSYLDSHVQTLRNFRDEYLLTNAPGRAFVAWYYRTSPPIAAVIEDYEVLRWATRVALTPIVFVVSEPSIAGGLLLLCVPLALARRRSTEKR